jgi:uncharacterized integral membrane protein
MKTKIIILLVLLILFTIFVSNNTEPIDVWFFFWPLNISKIVLLIITLVIGAILGLIAATVFGKSAKRDETKGENLSERPVIKSN